MDHARFKIGGKDVSKQAVLCLEKRCSCAFIPLKLGNFRASSSVCRTGKESCRHQVEAPARSPYPASRPCAPHPPTRAPDLALVPPACGLDLPPDVVSTPRWPTCEDALATRTCPCGESLPRLVAVRHGHRAVWERVEAARKGHVAEGG